VPESGLIAGIRAYPPSKLVVPQRHGSALESQTALV